LKSSVCVIIPHYNDIAGLENALKSVYSQTRLPEEVIVVDDQSPDVDIKSLEELSSRYGFVLLQQTNQGQSAARNLGVNHTNCSHICFLDQDDLFLKNHIEDLLLAWDSNPRLAFVYGDAWRQDENGHVFIRTTYRPDLEIETASLFVLAGKDILITPGMTMFSRSHFISVGGFDERLRGYEDDDLIFRLVASGAQGKKIEAPVLIWTYNMSSTSFSVSMQRSRDVYFRKLHEFFDNEFYVAYGMFVFKDILLARFYKMMINDAVRLARQGGKDFEVVQNNLKYFCEVGLKSPGLTSKQRRSLRFSRFAITKIPARAIQASFSFAIRAKAFLRL
jgi:glycosyltransferase involved in cell wall biosynthesis